MKSTKHLEKQGRTRVDFIYKNVLWRNICDALALSFFIKKIVYWKMFATQNVRWLVLIT